MTILVCGAGADSDGLEELIGSGALDHAPAPFKAAGSRMRCMAARGHMPTIDRNECESYVPGCVCTWTGADTADLGAALAAWPTHLTGQLTAAVTADG